MNNKGYRVVGTPNEEPIKHVSLDELLKNSRGIDEMTIGELLEKVEKTYHKLNELNARLESDDISEPEREQILIDIDLINVEVRGVIIEFKRSHPNEDAELQKRMQQLMQRMLPDENQS